MYNLVITSIMRCNEKSRRLFNKNWRHHPHGAYTVLSLVSQLKIYNTINNKFLPRRCKMQH